jgi:hypothetical protein
MVVSHHQLLCRSQCALPRIGHLPDCEKGLVKDDTLLYEQAEEMHRQALGLSRIVVTELKG